jgi:Tfp pilus assembly protein PilV
MSMTRIANILRNPRRVFSNEGGFSLIEVIAALFIFTLLTLGLVPLLTSSIRGTNTARADTIGKNAALKAMERVRGLPYHVSYATSTTKVDVLDLFYPDAATDVVVGGRTLYRTTCAWNALTNIACPRDIPENYTVTFEAQFVDPVATGTQPAAGETATSYANAAPAATYAWNSSSADTPPRQILQMTIITTWTVGGSNESYTLTSLVTDRSFGGRKLKGTATVGYGLDFYAFYDTKKNAGGGAGAQSASNLFVVRSDSDIEGRRLSTSIQNTTAARAELERAAGGTLGTIDAATSSVLRAPPDQNPANITALTRTLGHSDFSNALITAIGPSTVSGLTALAASAAPSATGDSEITGVVSGTDDYVYMKDPQLNNADYNALHLSSAGTGGPSIANIERINGLSGPLPGITAPVTTGLAAVGGTRAQTLTNSVHTQATVGFDRVLLLKSDWIPDPAPIFGGGTLSGAEGAIIVIEDFQAATVCDSNKDGTGSGTARYQASLYYWADPTQNGSRTDGSYRRITFDVSSTSAGADPLAAVMAQNSNNGPLVYDASSDNQRIYLFGKTLGAAIEGGGRNARRAAYLSTWNSLTTTASSVTTSTDEAGEAVAAVNSSIDGALGIETADYDTTNQVDAILAFTLGSLSCFAEDGR